MPIEVKICGLTDESVMRAALDAGVDYVGLVFYPPSPRYLSPKTAAPLAELARGRAQIMALFVDPDDTLLGQVMAEVSPEWVQLQGSETPARVAEIKQLTGRPVVKAIKIGARDDLRGADAFAGVADLILYDAKAPKSLAGALPGGNGLAFDWTILSGEGERQRFMLSGGLDGSNVAEALAITGAPIVDVSSGVEDAPGTKNAQKIHEFVAAVRAHERRQEERQAAHG